MVILFNANTYALIDDILNVELSSLWDSLMNEVLIFLSQRKMFSSLLLFLSFVRCTYIYTYRKFIERRCKATEIFEEKFRLFGFYFCHLHFSNQTENLLQTLLISLLFIFWKLKVISRGNGAT